MTERLLPLLLCRSQESWLALPCMDLGPRAHAREAGWDSYGSNWHRGWAFHNASIICSLKTAGHAGPAVRPLSGCMPMHGVQHGDAAVPLHNTCVSGFAVAVVAQRSCLMYKV